MQSIRKRLSVATTAAMLAWIQLPSSTFAQDATHAVPQDAELRLSDLTLGAYPYGVRKNIAEAGSILLERETLITLGVASAMIVTARQFDTRAQDYFHGHSRLGALDKLGNDILGTGVPGAILGGGIWLYGDLRGSSYEIHAGQAMLETLVTTGIVTAVMKGSIGRERPDASDRYSFPSGHTSTVFASATVLHQFYGWKAGVPSYALAALTAASRISENRHWLSDTVAGASVGILIGNAFSKMHLRRIEKILGERVSLRLLPVPEPGGGRVLIQASF